MTEPRPVRVLVVDPSSAQRRAASTLLPLLDMEVSSASNGLEGLEQALALRPQILLTELVLSGLSGLELIRRCREKHLCARVLVVTAASGEWATSAAFAAGADHVLLKPTDWGALLPLVRSLTAGPAQQLRDLLLAHGAPPHWAGLDQAARCAELLAQHKCSLLKEAYIQVAREARTTPQCVSKNIERLGKDLAARGKLDFLPLPAGVSVPGNRDFLAALVRCVTFPL